MDNTFLEVCDNNGVRLSGVPIRWFASISGLLEEITPSATAETLSR